MQVCHGVGHLLDEPGHSRRRAERGRRYAAVPGRSQIGQAAAVESVEDLEGAA